MRHRAGLWTVASLVGALCAGCAHGATTIPPVATSVAPDAMAQKPASVSPASFHPPPMTVTPAEPAATMAARRPQSDIAMTGWTQLPGSANTVAGSPDRSLWVLSTQGSGGDYYIYHYVNGVWTNVPGAARRLAVAPDGSLWVVTAGGGIYRYNGAWSTIAGGASDISIGADGSVYVISNQGSGPYGRGIWRYASGAWTQQPGSGVGIAASWDTTSYAGPTTPGGYYVVNLQQAIYYFDPPTGYHQLSGSAYQVAPTRSGGLFALGLSPGFYGYPVYYRDLNTGTWTQQPGSASSIATDGVTVYVTNTQGGIYASPVSAQHIFGNGTPLTGRDFGGTVGGGSLGGWGPTLVANTFGFPVQSGFDGRGTTVAIVIASNITPSDLFAYLGYFATPSTGRTLGYQLRPGASATPVPGKAAFEATLDIETVAGLAPGANVINYIVPDLYPASRIDAYEAIISDGKAKVVSMSFGGCESSNMSGESSVIQNGANSGIAFVASSGDQGDLCYGGTDPYGNDQYYYGVNYPASDPNVLGVGGTESERPEYPLNSSTAWHDYGSSVGELATGGGVSTTFAMPSYQVGIPGVASTQGRNVPDVAMPAAWGAVYFQSGWAVAYGTSWSAPQFAALLANVYSYCNAVFVRPAVLPYYVYETAGPAAFLDATSGSNQFDGSPGAFSAHPGYDNTTGFGVPNGMAFAQTLCPNRVPAARARRPAAESAIAGPAPSGPVRASVVRKVHGTVDRGARAASARARIQVVLRPSATLASDERAVIAVLQSAGFTIAATFGNHLVIDADGPTPAVEGLFATKLHDVDQGRYGVRYMPVTDALIPASLAPYVAGLSLDNVVDMKYL